MESVKSENEGPSPEFDMGKGEMPGLSSKDPAIRFEAEERKRLLEAYIAARPSAKIDGTPIISITRAAHCLNDGDGELTDDLYSVLRTRIHWACQQSTSYTGRGTFPVRRVETTQYTTIHYYIEFISCLAPDKVTARHIVECPGCMNILSFDLTPAYKTDKSQKFSLTNFLSAILLSEPICTLTHGYRFDKGRRRSTVKDYNPENPAEYILAQLDHLHKYGSIPYSDAALYFHKFISL
jgi:hypothetical protein